MLSNKCISCGMRVAVKDDKDVAVCPNCNRLYFSQVKKYINDKGPSSINDMHKVLGIPIPVLEKFLDDDRLFDPLMQKKLKAENARRKEEENSRSKKEAMLRQMISELGASKPNQPTPEVKRRGQGMHFINQENNNGGRRR